MVANTKTAPKVVINITDPAVREACERVATKRGFRTLAAMLYVHMVDIAKEEQRSE